MFKFNIHCHGLTVSMDENTLVRFNCNCQGERFFDLLCVTYECETHKGMTTANHLMYIQALHLIYLQDRQ